MSDAPRGAPRTLLRLEGLVLFLVAVFAYSLLEASWLLFLGFFLVPDLSILGYLAGPKTGSLVYNAAHTYAAPVALGFVLLWLDIANPAVYSVTWVAHIGFDRMLGYGLKYPTSFRETHLGWIGRAKPAP